MIFFASYWLSTVGLYKFNTTLLLIFGIPFFHILWGAGNGIIFAYYFGEKIYQRCLSILIFAGLTVGFESIVEHYKRVEHMGKFTNIHEYFYNVVVLAAFGFILVSLFESRVRNRARN